MKKYTITREQASDIIGEIKNTLVGFSDFEMSPEDIEAFDMAVQLLDECCPYHSIEGFIHNGGRENCLAVLDK